MTKVDGADKILLVPTDVTGEALARYVETGEIPPESRVENIDEWMARGRVADCDCGLLQCECTTMRQHKPDCHFRLSIASVVDVGILPCTCGGR